MLVELVGMPGAGKSILADHIARTGNGWSRIGELRKRARAALYLGTPARSPASQLIGTICRNYCKPGASRLRRQALLRSYRDIASRKQHSRRIWFADQLFLHGLFCTIGPQRASSSDLVRAVASLIEQTYSTASVVFIHVKPSTAQWHQQLQRQPIGQTRFGAHGDAGLMSALKDDTLYQSGFIDSLKARHYHVVEVCPAPSVDLVTLSRDCRVAVRTLLRG